MRFAPRRIIAWFMKLEAVPSTPKDFRRLLQAELIKRCERNSRYSLRAFAQSLQISHATLSHILASRRPLTKSIILKLGNQLGLSPTELNAYVEATPSVQKKKVAQAPVPTQAKGMDHYQEITIDTFLVISEWYHDAIAELTHLENFVPDSKWIAKVLGITVTEVNMAVERLERLELLEIKEDGSWIDLSKDNSTCLDPNFTTSALKKYQKKVLELSTVALMEAAKSEREHVSNMVAIQPEDLPEVKNRINEFRSNLMAFLQRKGVKPKEVYQLAISFFPITKKTKLKETQT